MTIAEHDAAGSRLPTLVSLRARPWFSSASTWSVLFLLTVAQRPAAAFRYDAGTYWSGSRALFTPDSVYSLGILDQRGVLTPVVYAPAALADRLLSGAGPVAVLVENAVLIALLGAVILPAVAGALGVRHPAIAWVCAGLTWFTVARFAPYPLMDVPAAVLVFGAVALIVAVARPWVPALAGLGVGLALNLRPAYLLVFGVLLLAVVVLRRWAAATFLVGCAVGLVPQLVFNLLHGAGLSATPPSTAMLVGFQASVASFTVRYDTLLEGDPRQYYCDSSMAAAASAHPVDSTLGLVWSYVTGLPESLGFLVKKVAASLAWSSTTPYNAPAAAERYDLTVPVVLITVAGVAALFLAARSGSQRGYALTLGGIALATCATLMTSAPEARYALPLVLVAIVGCAHQVARWRSGAPQRRWLLWSLGATALVVAAAAWGLADAVPPGPATAATCAVPH